MAPHPEYHHRLEAVASCAISMRRRPPLRQRCSVPHPRITIIRQGCRLPLSAYHRPSTGSNDSSRMAAASQLRVIDVGQVVVTTKTKTTVTPTRTTTSQWRMNSQLKMGKRWRHHTAHTTLLPVVFPGGTQQQPSKRHSGHVLVDTCRPQSSHLSSSNTNMALPYQ